MKYVQPYGVADTDAPYINGDPSIGRQGSIPPAAAFEHPMREIVNVITKNKFAPDSADLMQMLKGIRSQRVNYVEDTGSVNTLSVATDPPLGAYTIGLPLRVKVRETCTGGSTIDAGAGRVPIRLMNGASTGAGDLPAGGICELVYDGAAFQLTNFFGLGGGDTGDTTEFLIKIPYTVDSSPTPNIVQATFPPGVADNPPAAGDPYLVKIANTNTGSSVIRINAFGTDYPIRANGGGATAGLIQGDMQVGDVVLFLFDGANFWIQPNPLISADTTLTVPSPFPTVEAALLAIRRKTIAQNARVFVQLALGVFPPFTINHSNADRITVKGTMKVPGNITGNMFFQSGNSPAARANDSANNITMLRTRFGTEIQVPASAGAAVAGIENIGPGMPMVMDMLVTGPNYWSGEGVGRWIGAGFVRGYSSRLMSLQNVTAWGLDIGYYGGGTLQCVYTHATGCFRNGAHATGLASFGFTYSGMFGGALGGFTCNQNSWLGTFGCWSNYNANHGANATDNSQLTYHTSQAQGNAVIDITAGPISLVVVLNSAGGGGYGTISPTPGYINSYGAIIVEG